MDVQMAYIAHMQRIKPKILESNEIYFQKGQQNLLI